MSDHEARILKLSKVSCIEGAGAVHRCGCLHHGCNGPYASQTMIADRVRNREELARLMKQGRPAHYFFFWGHKPLPNGEIGKSCLSQWWPSAFSIDGVNYPTAEHLHDGPKGCFVP